MQFLMNIPEQNLYLLCDIPAWSLVKLNDEYLLVTDLYTNDLYTYSVNSALEGDRICWRRLCLKNGGERISFVKNTKVILVADASKVLLTIKE